MPPFDLKAWLAEAAAPSPIVQAGAAVLRRAAAPVRGDLLGTKALARLIDIMVETMRLAPGVGLAAPQIGVPLRVFVAEDTEDRMARLLPEERAARGRAPLPLLAVVNPSVTAASEGRVTFFEGCLSVVGYGALVERAAAVAVRGLDMHGTRLAMQLQGWPARIMQHEADHLDGALYVDRMISRSLACDRELARLSALPVDQVMRELIGPDTHSC